MLAFQITSVTIVFLAICSSSDRGKHQRYASLAFVRGIHRWLVNSPHKWSVTRKMFLFDVIVSQLLIILLGGEKVERPVKGTQKLRKTEKNIFSWICTMPTQPHIIWVPGIFSEIAHRSLIGQLHNFGFDIKPTWVYHLPCRVRSDCFIETYIPLWSTPQDITSGNWPLFSYIRGHGWLYRRWVHGLLNCYVSLHWSHNNVAERLP